ncbi:MAG TPA: VOC family protein [Solirubrobacterales bacterium]|nr:VOC family protein [Solirubrobacterales bacterium]
MTADAAAEAIDEALSARADGLYLEECRARDLAERFGTPLYVVSEDQLRRNARRFQAEFGSRWRGPFLLLPSIKANQSLALRRILTEEGTGCDAFGEGELEAAMRTGTDPDRVSLNGPMKGDALLERAVRTGVRITLDSRAELARAAAAAERIGRTAMVRLRHRPDLVGFDSPSEMSPAKASVRDALQRYKAGIPTEDLLAIGAEEIAGPSIELTGLHLHLGRHSADPEMWRAAVDDLANLIAALRERWNGWSPRELDLGGGYPAPRDPFGRLLEQRSDAPDRSPPPAAFAEAICPRLERRLADQGIDPAGIRLELEPGRALYADAGIHLATVGNVKRQTIPTPLTWVETDTSDAYLPDVNLEFNRWTVITADRPAAEPSLVADVTGRTCALDVLVPDAGLPEVEPGEVLAFLDTGAYQDAGAHNFNALPRPGTVLVHGAEAELIRRHETIEDVFARDLIPERLRDGSPAAMAEGWAATGLDHVSVTCSDLDRSLDFYSGLLGIEVRARGEASGESEFEITGIDGASVRWADLELRHGQVVELISYLDPAGTPIRPEPNDPGSTHLALRVGDVDAAYARLREAGLETRSEPTTIEAPGAWQGARAFYATDPDGVTVELIQPATPARGQ